MARPLKTFASFVGQRRVVDTMRRLADGARATNRAVPHLLLIAPAGLGKTSLARALAQHAGSYGEEEEPRNFHMILAGRGSLLQVHAVLRAAGTADFVFVDEAHSLGLVDAELLYLAIDSNRTMGIDDQGRLDRTRFEPVNPMTLVLATNQPGRLPKALESRLIPLALDPYTERELHVIAQRVARHHGVDLTAQAARIIAQRADGSPRRVEQMLLLVDSLAPRGVRLTQSQVENVLTNSLGYDEHGLTPLQRRLLSLLDRTSSLRAERIINLIGLDPQYAHQRPPRSTSAIGYCRSASSSDVTPAGRFTASAERRWPHARRWESTPKRSPNGLLPMATRAAARKPRGRARSQELRGDFAAWLREHLGFQASAANVPIIADGKSRPRYVGLRGEKYGKIWLRMEYLAGVVLAVGLAWRFLVAVPEGQVPAIPTALIYLAALLYLTARVGRQRTRRYTWVECKDARDVLSRDDLVKVADLVRVVRSDRRAKWDPAEIMVVTGPRGFDSTALSFARARGIECYYRKEHGFVRAA